MANWENFEDNIEKIENFENEISKCEEKLEIVNQRINNIETAITRLSDDTEVANSLEKKLLLKIRSVPIKANTKLLKNSYGFCFSFAMSFYD